MTTEEAVKFLSSRTQYQLSKETLELMAARPLLNGTLLTDVEDMQSITAETEDYCLIELYRAILRTPWSTPSVSISHGGFSQSIGRQVMTAANLEYIKRCLWGLYKKYGLDDEADALNIGGLSWLNEDSLDV